MSGLDAKGGSPAAGKPSALGGRRILELGGEPVAYAGRLLAGMGADVVKIEPPGGGPGRGRPPFLGGRPGPLRSLPFLYANAGKRSVTLDLSRPEGREIFRRLAARADGIVESLPPGSLERWGLGAEDLWRERPTLVVASVSGFGRSGPRREWLSTDLVASALGGCLEVTGHAGDPPVRLAGSHAYAMGSSFAAAGTLIALHHAERKGEGQRVDVSLQEAMAAVGHVCGAGKWLDDGILPKRAGTGLFASVPSGAYPCRDGLVYLMVNRPAHWTALARWIHEETGNDAVQSPLFEGPSSSRYEVREMIDAWIAELTSRHAVAEVVSEGQRRHIAFTPVRSPWAVATDPQLEARRFFVEIEIPSQGVLRMPGAPYRHGRTPWRLLRSPPAPGEHNADVLGSELGLSPAELDRLARAGVVGPPTGSPAAEAGPAPTASRAREASDDGRAPALERKGAASAPPRGEGGERRREAGLPLAGLRALELTAGMAGPWVGRLLAYFGADVIKLESLEHPDVTRLYVPPWAPERGIEPQLSPWFTDWNAGKRFVALDLRRPQAVNLALRLVSLSDVVIENFRPGALEHLGLGYAELARARPDVVLLSTTGFGATGPCKEYVSWGPNIEAASGLATASGFPERPCTLTHYAYPDALSAIHGLFAVLCALEHRRATGEGQSIDLSQLEATAAVFGDVLLEALAERRDPPRRGNRRPGVAPEDCYPCRGEDRWCAISVETDAHWQALCRALGRDDWARDNALASAGGREARLVELDAGIAAWTRERDAHEAMALLQAAGVPAGVSQTVEDQLRRDPHLEARGFFERIEHVVKGEVVANGIPIRLERTPGRSGRAGAAVGEDTEAVFGGLLGLGPDEIERLEREGVIQRGRRSVAPNAR